MELKKIKILYKTCLKLTHEHIHYHYHPNLIESIYVLKQLSLILIWKVLLELLVKPIQLDHSPIQPMNPKKFHPLELKFPAIICSPESRRSFSRPHDKSKTPSRETQPREISRTPSTLLSLCIKISPSHKIHTLEQEKRAPQIKSVTAIKT